MNVFLSHQKKKERKKYRVEAFSQEGEDLLLRRIFESQDTGFYVDVGAHHPMRFSNTYLFYNKGWRGINIDATPGSMLLFNRFRPQDINLEIPIAQEKKKMIYHIFNEPALNTFSRETAQQFLKNDRYRIVAEKELEALPLSAVLKTYLPQGQSIDFMSIDVEGLDYEILRSNDWDIFLPKVLLVEIHANTPEQILRNSITGFLAGLDYIFYAKTVYTCFFIQRSLYDKIHPVPSGDD